MKRLKQFGTLAFTTVLFAGMLLTKAGAWSDGPALSGSGSSSDPWMIYNEEDLQTAYTYIGEQCDQLSDKALGVTDCFRLGADIDLSSEIVIRNNADYDLAISFAGTFDGGGHTISNWKMGLWPHSEYSGGNIHTYPLFPINFGTIKDLNIILSKDYASLPDRTGDYLSGGLVCDNYGLIQNCRVEGTLAGTGLRGPSGLIAGTNGNGGKIVDCSASGTIKVPSGGYDTHRGFVGGIVGESNAASISYLTPNTGITWTSSDFLTNDAGMDSLDAPLIRGCTADVTISGTAIKGMGGILGGADKHTLVEDCSASVQLSAGGQKIYNCLGGVVGSLRGTVKNCKADGKITLTSTSAKTPSAVGGVVGLASDTAEISGCSSIATLNVSDLTASTGEIVGQNDGAVLSGNQSTTAPSTPSTSLGEISVTLNGLPVSFDQPPIMQQNRTLVPLRAIFEAMGATVAWDEATRTAFAVREDVRVSIQIGSNTLYRNDKPIALDVPAQTVNDRTLVPVRAISEAFGAQVSWDAARNMVLITTASTQTPTTPAPAPDNSGSSSNLAADGLPNCIICNNTGKRDCIFCRGEKTIVDPYYDPLKGGINRIDCPHCDSTGKIPCVCARGI